MTEQLITYQTAVLAKEKGFEYFNSYTKQDSAVEWRVKLYNTCTQSLLQKWLREVHKTLVNAMFTYDEYPDTKYFPSVYFKGNVYSFSSEYETYEQALEAGLLEALKLIP